MAIGKWNVMKGHHIYAHSTRYEVVNVFSGRNEEAFGDIQGVHVIADDMIIAAKNDVEHYEILKTVLQRAREQGIKFNKDRNQLKVKDVMYMGHRVSDMAR